jgi:hypothetical protein
VVWNTGWYPLWEIARKAAWDAAWNAAQAAGEQNASHPFPWVKVSIRFEVSEAASEADQAAGALFARDLIDETTDWNQAAYDLLTGPWRRVIGPIHPDDEVLR